MSLAVRVQKLESRRRPVFMPESKALRDQRVAAAEGEIGSASMPNDLLTPNQAAAIRAWQRADT